MAPLKEDEKGGQEKLSFRSVPTQRGIVNAQKKAKKLKKLKNTIMTSFQATIDREWPRKIENKNYRSVPLLPDA